MGRTFDDLQGGTPTAGSRSQPSVGARPRNSPDVDVALESPVQRREMLLRPQLLLVRPYQTLSPLPWEQAIAHILCTGFVLAR